ncbi:Hypothetical Protein FCC1311_063822 [Hondaea fermentalgiana]|uniref:ADP-ribosylglycohydrolase n=1 Tax=Hondaea fermentalgiana TaxID=2315210 RepID=A0A2R5GGZ7_9STRA|nr:Hypothetical Protein FCC1311_063822 [Hondaea fermentalgiana]|eukprot:GBG30162.1 Hypothetical Protein FCC1311_063822 [Hondaea fermentalgiana]
MASDDEDRVRASLQAFVVGEALAMPVHWFYDPVKLEQEYGRVDKMMAPKRSHAESFMTSMEYKGSIDILFDKAVFYEGFDIEHIKSLSKEDREALSSDVGIFVNSGSDERPHYHLSLKKGQNTANVCVARLLMRYLATVNKGGKDRYDPKEFIEAFRDYMTTDPREHPDDIAQIKAHNDAYLDVYVRKFFENASNGLPLTVCAYDQRDRWSIGSLDGLVMAVPLIAAYRHEPEAFLVGRALEHQVLTHRSVTISAVVTVLVPLLQQLWRGEDPDKALDAAMDKMRPPAITGPQMLETYKANMGPDYIPKWDKWDQHMVSVPDMTLRELVHDLIAQDKPLQDVAGFHRGEGRFSTTCYCEQAMSIVLFLATKYGQDLQAALQANAELGGHSTARGAILGAIIGARVGTDAIPRDWLAGLAAPDQVINEIDALLGASTKAAR